MKPLPQLTFDIYDPIYLTSAKIEGWGITTGFETSAVTHKQRAVWQDEVKGAETHFAQPPGGGCEWNPATPTAKMRLRGGLGPHTP